jgi:hypothetical protein
LDGRWQNNRGCNHILEKNCSINKTSRRVDIRMHSMINFNNCKETKKNGIGDDKMTFIKNNN